MGCTVTKPSTNSPPWGLDKLKVGNGYAKKRYAVQRSTGQKYSGEDLGRIPLPEPRESSPPDHHGSSTGGGRSGKLVNGEGKKDCDGGGGSGGSSSRNDGRTRITPVNVVGKDELVDGWPKWLTDNVPRDVLAGIVPRSADSYLKLDKIGQGSYSNVYKARDRETGKIVALKKVKFDTSDPASVKFMAREIMILQKLDHPNIMKLEGLATSRVQYSLYLVFEYMHSDLGKIISRPDERLTEPQVKCYMHQLLSGLQHCHDRGILHRDIKGSNLLIDRNGMLKIADFGLANYFDPNKKHRLTGRVVTLWYRSPELLLGATKYGTGIDLWSAGCLLAEMFAGRPIMPGRTEVEQLHQIFKLCGTPSEECWKKLKGSRNLKPPPKSYRPKMGEVFRDFPASSLCLLKSLLDLDPSSRGCAGLDEFFRTSPLACDLSGLPVIEIEEDETMPTIIRSRSRHLKTRLLGSQCQQESDQSVDIEKPKAESVLPKGEITEASPELNQQQQGSRACVGSSSVQHTRLQGGGTPPPPLYRRKSYRQKMSPGSEAYFNAFNNIKNLPLVLNGKSRPITYSEDRANMYTLDRLQRSASPRVFLKTFQRKLLKLQSLDSD